MARKKITEFKAKKLLQKLVDDGEGYDGLSFPNQKLIKLDDDKKYVVKVDQGAKKRFKKNLIYLDIKKSEVDVKISVLKEKGYVNFLVEEYFVHDKEDERYLSIERTEEGLLVLFSKKGGVDIEEYSDEVQKRILDSESINEISIQIGIQEEKINALVEYFEKYYISFLEINPLVIKNNNLYFLDVAIEVDSTAEFLVEGAWTHNDYALINKKNTEEEKNIEILSMNSQAALKLDSLNKNGSIFVLLSGGGASVVIADEVYNLGYGKELGNYGEYSGNPNEQETYVYAKNLLSLLLKSESPQKVLIIGGGVANFTDIKKTFEGVIIAISEVKEKMQDQKIKVYVRRGGPNQEEGLRNIKKFLNESNLLGIVEGSEFMLTDVVKEAIKHIDDRH